MFLFFLISTPLFNHVEMAPVFILKGIMALLVCAGVLINGPGQHLQARR